MAHLCARAKDPPAKRRYCTTLKASTRRLMFELNYNAEEFRFPPGRYTRTHRFAVERQKLLAAWSTVAVGEQNGIIKTIAGTVETVPRVIRDFLIKVPDNYL